MLTSKHTTAPETVFLLASFQMKTHSPRLSPLPFARLKAHPLPTLHFLSLAVLLPLYVLLICHSSLNISGLKIFYNFFFLRQSPPLIPDSAPPLFKPLSLSFAVRSRMNAAWLCQCQLFANLPGCVCVPMWVWWEAPALEARVIYKPRTPAGVGSGEALWGLQLSFERAKTN